MARVAVSGWPDLVGIVSDDEQAYCAVRRTGTRRPEHRDGVALVWRSCGGGDAGRGAACAVRSALDIGRPSIRVPPGAGPIRRGCTHGTCTHAKPCRPGGGCGDGTGRLGDTGRGDGRGQWALLRQQTPTASTTAASTWWSRGPRAGTTASAQARARPTPRSSYHRTPSLSGRTTTVPC